jgi:fibronectin type 3 domain-containing protein
MRLLALPVLVAVLALTACEPGENTYLACVFGDRVACDALLSPPPPPPPPVEGTPAAPAGLTVALDGSDVFLDWDNSPETDVREYVVYQATYDRTSNLGYDSIGRGAGSDFRDNFLHVDGTTYFWRVTAVDNDGNESAPSQPVSLVYCAPGHTCTAPPGPPAAPTGLTVFSQDARGIGLDWNPVAEPDIRSYYVYRSTTSGQYGEALFSVSQLDTEVVVSATDYGLRPFTTYFFAVSAIDADGDGREGPRSDEVRVFFCPAAVSGCPAAPPATTGLRLVSRDAGGISLDWDDNGATRFVVYDDVVGLPERRLAFATQSSFLHAAPSVDVHRYSVAAIDADGRLGPRTNALEVEWCGSANPACARGPRTPTGLTATPQPFAVALDWSDNTETDLRGYRVWMATQEAGPYSTTHSGLVTASQRTVFDLPANQPRWFRITAVDAADRESAPSAAVSAAACDEVCHPAVAHLRRSGPKSYPLALDVSGSFDRVGATRREGDAVVATGFGFAGAFALHRAPKGLDPELRSLADAGLDGTWQAVVDWSIVPGVTATKHGVALATFSGTVGRGCLRFDETTKVKRRGTARSLVTNGTFTFLGGSAEAAQLLGGASYSVETRPDGTLHYDGKGVPAAAAPLPPECLALSR